MATQAIRRTRPAVATTTTTTTCRRCHGRHWIYLEGGYGHFPYEVTCPVCGDPDDDDDPDGGDDCRWNDDVAESAPDDSSRFAMVAARYRVA